ncbi:MAG: 4Fe-4S binding protein [Armatimonadota bacterium]
MAQEPLETQDAQACELPEPEEKTRLRRTVQWIMLALVPIVIIGGLFWPYLGFIVPLVMITGMLGGFFRGRWVCGWLCPRGAFLERVMSKMSFNLGIPAFLRKYSFRWVLFALLMGFMVFRLSANPASAEHWGRVFVQLCMVTTGVGLLLAVLFHPRTWCSFCPVGTFSSTIGGDKQPMQIAEGCRGCKLCEQACPLNLEIAKHADGGEMKDRDCLRCGECATACPANILKV